MTKAQNLGTVAWVSLVLGLPAWAQDPVSSAAPLAVSIPFAPMAADIGGSTRLFYEFRVANLAQHPGEIGELTVSDSGSGAVLNDYKGDALSALMSRPGAKADDKDFVNIPAGGIATIFMETTIPPGRPAPSDLRWKIDFHTVETTETGHPEPAIEGVFAIRAGAPIEIGFPLPPGDWFAANGPSNTSSHRRTLLAIDGRARIAQRFAIDWMKLGPDGRLFHDDKALNANWYGFGTPVLAVADATVSAANDGLPENQPSKLAVPITLQTIGGNYLILDLGAGHYAFYAHLQPGSARVKVGDKVHRGQVLALLGNTGNSGAPHLHFDIADTNATLAAEGLPYAFATYQSVGKAIDDSITGPSGWKPEPGSTIVIRAHAMPEEDEVVHVP